VDKFLSYDNDLARLINSGATVLYYKLININPDELGMPEHCLNYFKTSHSTRLFFSIETSAHLLYRAIKITGKQPSQLVLMDYGAGVGTLYLLAKIIGCRQVIYNDHLEDWRRSGELVAEAINVQADHYIVGDIRECLQALDRLNIKCDIITSRNVIEHIYKLSDFYSAIYASQPSTLVFSSTTANKRNPASVIKHWLWHRKWEKVFRGKRSAMIERLAPDLTRHRKEKLVKATRGLASDDLKAAVDTFMYSGTLPNPALYGSNTCDPSNGVWAEHLLAISTFRKLINEKMYSVSFAPGFWDTHYRYEYLNRISRLLNRFIAKNRVLGMRLAPFIYVIARPKNNS
jgi:2-polyprenyl-3-methyl-5-hydroxy-6-metoxy-1,4-benzoquinol methylase